MYKLKATPQVTRPNENGLHMYYVYFNLYLTCPLNHNCLNYNNYYNYYNYVKE